MYAGCMYRPSARMYSPGMATKPIQFRVPQELLDRIDDARGETPRTQFVLRAVETALGVRSPLVDGTTAGAPVGKIERSGDGRQRGGVAAVIRPAPQTVLGAVKRRAGAVEVAGPKPVLRGGHDTRKDRCPMCQSLTYTVARGKRGCRSCRWTGPT